MPTGRFDIVQWLQLRCGFPVASLHRVSHGDGTRIEDDDTVTQVEVLYRVDMVDDRLGLVVLTQLQVGIYQVIQRVQFALCALAQSKQLGALDSRGGRARVRGDRFVPHAELGVDVPGHV